MLEQTELQMMETKLLALCQQDDGFVATLNGEWGVGKTYFWNDFVKKNFNPENLAYISLFGKESLKEVQSSILVQISERAKWVSKITDIMGLSRISGIDVSSVLSIIDKTDFKDVIVCFDDFERSSDKLQDKDILGLISELKEQKNCKVIMIHNQDQIKSEVFSTYKDKVIDYELHFRPTALESYNHISDKLKAFGQYPLEYFERKGITNIRIMKRAINALNDFKFIESHINGFDGIEQEIVGIILKVAVSNTMYHTFDLEKLVQYTEQKREKEGQNDFKINNDYENILYLLDIEDSRYFFPNDITKNINDYIQSSIAQEDQLIKIIEQRKYQSNRYEIEQAVRSLYDKYNYDLKYELTTFAKDMFALLNKHKDYIIEIVNPNGFIFYIEELSNINADEDYHSFGVDCLKKYLTKYLKTARLSSLDSFGNLHKIIGFDKSIQKHIDKIEASKKEAQVDTKEDIVELMTKPKKQGSWGDEPELLMLVKEETYKQYIREEAGFFEEIIDFIRWTQGIGGGSGFDEVATRLVAVLKDIRSKGDDSVKFKISRALKHLNRDVSIEEV